MTFLLPLCGLCMALMWPLYEPYVICALLFPCSGLAMTPMGPLCGHHVALVWPLYMASVCPLYGLYMALIWLLCGPRDHPVVTARPLCSYVSGTELGEG